MGWMGGRRPTAPRPAPQVAAPSAPGTCRHRSAVDTLRTALRGTGQLLLTLGAVVLLFCLYLLWGTGLVTARAQAELTDELERSWVREPVGPASPAARTHAPLPGGAFARLHVPSLAGYEPWTVVEGVDVPDLRRGPGHMPGTALPGQVGNLVLSGHRTTYGAPFNRWDELGAGDEVVLETQQGWFTYTLTGSQVVAPTAVDVTLPVPGRPEATPAEPLLTMTTCEPEYSAAERMIVSGRLTASRARADGPPPRL